MKANYLEVITKRLKSNDIYFIDKHGDTLGSINVIDENIIYNNAISGTEHILNKPQGIGASGVNHGEYLYWDTNVEPANWKVAGDKIHLGTNAGKYNQGQNGVAIGAYAGYSGQADNSIAINASGEILSAPLQNALYINPIREEIKNGVTGEFSTGISTSQSTNVVSYNPNTKEVTYRDLGLYNDSIVGATTNLISTKHIIPNISNATGNIGLDLGSMQSYWRSIYVNNIFSPSIVLGNQNDPETLVTLTPTTGGGGLQLNTTTPGQTSTSNLVTTSTTTPGQIDSNLLPFSGLSYIGNFNPKNYLNFSDDFTHQLNNMVYNLSYEVTTTTQNSFFAPNTKTNSVFQKLSGVYYIINGLNNGETITMNFPRIRYTTNLTTYDKTAVGNITSSSILDTPQNYIIKNNDILLLSATLIKTPNTLNGISILFNWSIIEFKIPINGVTTLNIVDNAITNNKIANNAVTFSKLSTELQNLLNSGNNAIDFSQSMYNILSNEINKTNSEISLLKKENDQLKEINQYWRSKVNAIEEFIKILLRTYTVKNEIDDTGYDYTGINQSYENFLPKFYYPEIPAFNKDVEIIPILPTNVSGSVDSYSIDSPLPTGLDFNTVTGAITGTPTSITTIKVYNITATNEIGSYTETISIEIK